MDCPNCELKQRQFYCENCLRQHLLAFRVQHNHLVGDRDTHIANAQRSLTSIVEPARLRRADLKCKEDSVREIWDGLDNLRKTNEQTREKLRILRETLSNRRRMLAIASATGPYPPSSSSASSPFSGNSTNYPSPYPRSVHSRRMSSTSSTSTSHTPSPTPRPGPSTPTTRTNHTFPSTPVPPQSIRPQLSTPSPSPSRPVRSPASVSTPYKFRRLSDGTLVPVEKTGLDANYSRQIEEATFQLNVLSDTLAKARSGLVQELVEVFSVVEVGGRPPLGGKAGTKGEWTIGGLVLPVPGDMRRYPPDHINAVLTHTIHFLSLLAFYLGVKLPFDVLWSRSSTPPSSHSPSSSGNSGTFSEGNIRVNGLLGVGTPWIGAIRGNEYGGWARWSTKHPLHVSAVPPTSNSSPPSSPQTSSSQSQSSASKDMVPPTPARRMSAFSLLPSRLPSLSSVTNHGRVRTTSTPTPVPVPPPSQLSSSSILAESNYEEFAGSPPSASNLANPNGNANANPNSNASAPNSSFTTALTMLLYNVCYLAFTQNVDIPLAQAGEVLGNLWEVCCSPELGKKSHATNPHLPGPTPSNFQLDFAQLLQATASNPSRARARGVAGFATSGREKDRRDIRGRDNTIVEEEEGWDLVDADDE